MIFVVVGLIVAGLVGIGLLRVTTRPELLLAAMGFVVSIVAINVHLGATLYFSRLFLLLTIAVTFARVGGGLASGVYPLIDRSVIVLLAGSIFVQLISLLGAPSVTDGVRQIFIYVSMMAIFLAASALGTTTRAVLRAFDWYLLMGALQGLLGVYQVVGILKGWPMYQDFMVGIPLGNPRMELRELWFAHWMPRAFGLFADPGHYGGYMAGVIILALSMLAAGHRTRLAYVTLICGIPGLLLSVSRGGIFALVLVGIPLLVYLLPRAGIARTGLAKPVFVTVLLFFVLAQSLVLIFPFVVDIAKRIDVLALLGERVGDFLDRSGAGKGDSMTQHIATRALALRALMLHPLFGIGVGNAAIWQTPEGEGWGGAHSHHLNMLGETGVIGAAFEWALMWYVAVVIWRSIPLAKGGSPERVMLVTIFTMYITIIFGNLLYEYYLQDFVWFIMGCGMALSRIVARTSGARVTTPLAARPHMGLAAT